MLSKIPLAIPDVVDQYVIGAPNCWNKAVFDSTGVYIAAENSMVPIIFVWNYGGKITHRFLLHQKGKEIDYVPVILSLCFNDDSSLLACSLAEGDSGCGRVLIFSLNNQYAASAAVRSDEFSCMASFDFLGIPIPTFNLNFAFEGGSLMWGSPSSATVSNSQSHSQKKIANTECVGIIPNLGRETYCEFLVSDGNAGVGSNILRVVDLDRRLYMEYEVLESGRCFRIGKYILDFTIPKRQRSLTHTVDGTKGSQTQIYNVSINYHEEPDASKKKDSTSNNNNGEKILLNGTKRSYLMDSRLENETCGKGDSKPCLSDFCALAEEGGDIRRSESKNVPKEGDTLETEEFDNDDYSPDCIDAIAEFSSFRFVSSSVSGDEIVVLDCGSGNCKVGFAGSALPKSVFPSVVGRPKYADVMEDSYSFSSPVSGSTSWDASGEGFLWRDCYVGSEAQSLRGVLALEHPVKRGVIRRKDFFAFHFI